MLSIKDEKGKAQFDNIGRYLEETPTRYLNFRGSPRRTSNPKEIESEWLEFLCEKAIKDGLHGKYSDIVILRNICNFPRQFVSKVIPRCLIWSSSLLDSLRGYYKAYNLFTSHFGSFNKNEWEGFLEFIFISSSNKRSKEIINHLIEFDESISQYNHL